MKVGYFIKDRGETLADGDTVYFDDDYEVGFLKYDLRLLAAVAAEYAFHEEDGCEWIKTGVVFTIVVDGKEVGDFDITVESEPVFSAAER